MPEEEATVESKVGPLEKVGHAVLRRMGKTCPDGGSTLEDQRVLTDDEQLELKNIARFTVMRAALAGALSAVVAAVAAMYAEKYFSDDSLNYWLLFGGASLIAAAVEVGYLYYDSLRAVHRISQACDVELFPEGEERSAMAGIMVRAAMELPNPPDKDPYVNPLREASKWRLLLGSLVYKGKVMVSNALAKVLPKWLSDADENLAEVAQRAVGVCVSASRDLHPNHLHMLTWMRKNSGVEVMDQTESVELFLQKLQALDEENKERVLDVLAMATIIDGRASRHEIKILSQVTGGESRPAIKAMLHQFRSGQGIESYSQC